MSNDIDSPSEKKIRDERAPFFKRVFRGWKSTIARLFLFALCASAIIALAIASQNKSFDKLPTERSVASRSLPVNAANIVAVDEIVASAEPLSEETTESVEVIVDETPSNEEAETLISEVLADIQPDEQQEIAFSDDVSEETDVVETVPDENAKSTAEVAQCASEASVELRPISISEIRIGDRVPGVNPEGNDGSDEALFASEDLYIFTFRVPKEDGTFCKAKLLRSESWLFDRQARFASVVDGHEFNEIDALLSERSPEYFDLNFQLEVWFEMPELGCVGWAKIVEIDDAFKYAPGEGNLVTGTFEHIAQETIDLQIEGQEKPIGCTPTHPIWSEDREEFVPAGELFEGERVRVLNGDTKRVVQKLPRPGPELVYNIEVFDEHVYHVTLGGVLVHNECPYLGKGRPHIRKTTKDAVLAAYNAVAEVGEQLASLKGWHHGHKTSLEYRRLKQWAIDNKLSRKQWRELNNKPKLYQVEDPKTNMKHINEDKSEYNRAETDKKLRETLGDDFIDELLGLNKKKEQGQSM